MVNFNDLIISLIDNIEYVSNQKYIEVNFSKICNDTIRYKYIKSGYYDYIYGFKVLRDDKYKLVITGKDKYKVYILPEQLKECTDEKIRAKVIRHFGEIADISIPKL